jgi:sodium/potassium-transporting ATPase subunit alpha
MDEHLSEDNPNKGAFLRNWIMKRDCVFARTSPDQKLIIVNACQNLSHIVAVTGDGVNDAPAIKKADIGIAMGQVGTDVAKDAADILLMDDNFANIVKGIKQGRIIFDTLKKIISYNLSSNISELMPVIGYFIFQFPIPLTTILILTIDIGSDVYPNIAFAYEGAESDIMDRSPRNAKTDNLCTLKLFAWSYLHMGMVEMTAGMLAYFVVMNDYGFKPSGIMGITREQGIEPAINDIYNPYDEYKGNSNAFLYENTEYLGLDGTDKVEVEDLRRQIDYISNADTNIDFRVMFYYLPEDTWGECAFPGENYKKDGTICWTLEAVRHAQSAYLANTIVAQVSNGFCYRTITVSMFQHVLNNWDLNLAYVLENVVVCILVYVPGLNYGLALRPIIVQHWTPCFGAFIILFLYSEFTKYLIRNVNNPDGSKGYFFRFYRY